ncbi:MAG: acetoacetate--CoA ligase, partial [Bauldia sp.]
MPQAAPKQLWTPSPERIERAQITAFARAHGLPTDYGELWRWSVADIERFWALIWSHFDVAGDHGEVLADRSMPGARWFPGTAVNYAGHAFATRDPDAIAIRHASELRGLEACTWGELATETAQLGG